MSFNVNFGIPGDPETLEAIGSAAPDLVLLQETNARWQDALVARYGQTHPHHRFADPHDWPAGGMGVMSRDPIALLDRLDAPGAPFFAHRIVVDSKLGRIQLVNVHLRPPMSDSGSWVIGFFSTRSDRLREIQHHHAAIDPVLPTLFAGDFNEETDGLAIGYLKELGYADPISGLKTRTWEWPVGRITLKFQLDHILHDDHFIAVRAAVVEAGRSDHKPIWVDFERMDP